MSNTNTEVLTTAYENLQGALTQANTVLPPLQEAIKKGNLDNYATTSDLEEKANESDLQVERSRIDSFITLSDGSTTGDAELIDGRIGADGITYSNIGNAIREQNNNLLENIELLRDGYEKIKGKFQLGGLSSGSLTNVKYRVCSKNTISYTRDITLIAENGYRFGIHIFEGDTFSMDSGWVTAYNISANTQFKIVIARVTEDKSETADIDVFSESVKILTLYTEKLEELKERDYIFQDNITKNITYLLNFIVGFIDTDGTIDTSKKYRISNKDIIYNDKDIYFSKDSNTYAWIVYYNSDGTEKDVTELSQKVNRWVIPKNSYFRISIAQYPLDNTIVYETIYDSKLSEITLSYDKTLLTSNVTSPFYEKDSKIKYMWEIAAFTGTDDLTIDYTRKDRIVTPFKCTNEEQLILTVDEAHYVWVNYYNNDGTFLQTVELNTKNSEGYLVIQSNSIFKIQVADYPINTSIVHTDINDLLNSIKLESVNQYISRIQSEKALSGDYNDLCKTLDWEIGFLQSTGDIDTTKKFRVSSATMTAKEDLIVKIDSGYYCWVCFKENYESTSFKNTIEIKNPSTCFIPKGSIYQIQLAKYPLKSSLVHTKVNELIDYLHIYTVKSEEEENKKYTSRWNDTIMCACHRGLGYVYPENTLTAFKNCYKNGLTVWELDIKKTSDNVLVLLHDPTINRTARNADGTELTSDINVSSLTYAELQDYDFGIYMGEQFKGEKIPTLEEALILAKKLNCFIVVDTMIESNAQEIYDLVVNTGMLNNVIFSEFETSSYSKLLTINNSLPFICSMNTADYNKVDAFVQLAGDKVNKCGMSVYYKVITKDLADYIHSKGLNLYLYVLDTPSAVLDSLQYNPDGIFTNVCHTSRIIAENTI